MKTYIPAKGDIVWLTFNPQSGHEQMGRRPAIIVSNTLFNEKTGLAIACPVTSTVTNYPLHVAVQNCEKIKGCIMVEQIKSVDYHARNIEFIEKASNELLNEVLAILDACLY